MRIERELVIAVSGAAWTGAGVTAVLDTPTRVFVLALTFAICATVPVLTVWLARRHVHAYLAGWVDRHEHGGGGGGGTRLDVEDQGEGDQRHGLRAA